MHQVRRLTVKLCPGIIFPTPYPQGYGVTPPSPRPPQKRARRWREHARARPVWQCRLCRTRALGAANTVRRPVFRDGPRPAVGGDDGARTRSLLATSPEPARNPSTVCSPAHRPTTGTGGASPPSVPQRLPRPPSLTRTRHEAAAARERTSAAARERLCARRDRIQHTQPMIFSQLHPRGDPFTGWPDTPPPTRQERTARYAFTRRGRATLAKGTSLCASQVERFVIERFTPRFLIDIEPVGEGVTAGPRDAVDSILKIGGWGTVRDRGETCRSGRPVRTGKTRTPRGA
ncbi:hypothetical protein SAMN02745831_03819 [Streptomyces sp. PgraA7]|nr:hypothetical protein SAMN02745831_03819 [Streptomyces sp. PgraA7]